MRLNDSVVCVIEYNPNLGLSLIEYGDNTYMGTLAAQNRNASR